MEFRGRKAFRDLIAVRHPDDPVDEQTGSRLGRRIPLPARAGRQDRQNRLHLDIHAGPERRAARPTGWSASARRC